MKIDFSGRKALVTGGTRGIGAAIARELAEAGATVVATGTSPKASDLASVTYRQVDFADEQQLRDLCSEAASGGFDILVNNAGINKIDLVEDIQDADWKKILAVNLDAPFALTRAVLPAMVTKKYGRIVNVSSIFGQVSKSMRASYSTSKFALEGLTKATALDHARENVLANAVAPGFIDTELTASILTKEQIASLVAQVPMARLGTSDEIARVVAFLASAQNTFITGQTIIADGGFTSV